LSGFMSFKMRNLFVLSLTIAMSLSLSACDRREEWWPIGSGAYFTEEAQRQKLEAMRQADQQEAINNNFVMKPDTQVRFEPVKQGFVDQRSKSVVVTADSNVQPEMQSQPQMSDIEWQNGAGVEPETEADASMFRMPDISLNMPDINMPDIKTHAHDAMNRVGEAFDHVAPRVDNREYRMMMEMRPVGSPFATELFYHYRNLIDSAREESLMWNKRHQLMRKARMAAEGDVPMPEKPSEWSGAFDLFYGLLSKGEANPVESAYERLMFALRRGARHLAPRDTAAAQAAYDCWIVNGQYNRLGIGCADVFRKHLTAAEAILARVTNPVVEEKVDGKETLPELAPDELLIADLPNIMGLAERSGLASSLDVALQDVFYLVFFDFNESALNDSAMPIIDTISQDIQRRQDITNVIVVGHTDTSGSAQYNERLSKRRANAVRQALVARGVNMNKVKVRGVGEGELRVPTDNNTREPANRRVEITFE